MVAAGAAEQKIWQLWVCNMRNLALRTAPPKAHPSPNRTLEYYQILIWSGIVSKYYTRGKTHWTQIEHGARHNNEDRTWLLHHMSGCAHCIIHKAQATE